MPDTDQSSTAPCRAAITTWPNLTTTEGTPIETTWDEWFSTFREAPRFRGDMKHPGWSAAVCEPCVRAKANVVGLSALVLDYDGGATLDQAEAHWREWFGVIHTTRKHTAEKHRFRVVLPLTRIITADEYDVVWRWAESIASEAGHTVDPATKDPARFWFLPGGATYEFRRLNGHPVDPEPILRSAREPELPVASAPEPVPMRRNYGDAALYRACERIRRAPEGTRNDMLNSEAYSIARLVSGGVIDDGAARAELRAAGLASGLSGDEVTKTLGSAFSAGLMKPRQPPPPLRPVRVTQGTGTDGAAPAAQPASITAIFNRADHVELAERARAILETAPMTHDDGSFWRYDADTGVWSQVAEEIVENTVAGFSGGWVKATGDNVKPLNITAGACQGAARVMRNAMVAAPNRALFRTAAPGIAFRDCFVTIEKGTVRTQPHAPEHLARAGLPFDYDPLEHPELDQFFTDLFEGCADAADRVALLQEFIGACLLGMAPSYQRCLVLYGTGNNGKSQLLDIARAAFPEGTVVALPPQKWDERFSLPLLVGARGNFVGELPTREIAASETFKAIVTGDPQTAERKNRDPFTFFPTAGHLFGSNSLPTAGDVSAGFFRRFVILPLTKVFPESGEGVERDIGRRIARNERQAIAAWAVAGAARLQKQGGYTVPASVHVLKEQWARDSDSVHLYLDTMTEKVERTPKAGMRMTDLYAAYRDWAKGSGFQPVHMINFSRRYTASGREHAVIDGRGRYFVRIRESYEL